ncbi:hypothetical protein QE152_g35793, partial [Popillia japonica]
MESSHLLIGIYFSPLKHIVRRITAYCELGMLCSVVLQISPDRNTLLLMQTGNTPPEYKIQGQVDMERDE